jgi:hypothetical protein
MTEVLGSRKYLALIIPAGLTLAGLAALLASFLPYGSVASAIAGSPQAGDQLQRGMDSLARNFGDILARLRYCSAGLLLSALLAAIQRARIRTWIEDAALPFPGFLRDAALSMLRGLRADGAINGCVLAALTLAGAALRIRFLGGPMNIDEAETFLAYASRPLYIGLSWYPAPNNHLFHTMFVHFAWLLFGEREWVIRLPALFAGILLIPLTYWAARSLYDKHAALIAAAMVAPASTLISYSADGRGYTILCAFFLLLLIVGRYLLDHDSEPAWLLWALLAALGFYTIPIMLYAAGTAALWLAIGSSRRPADLPHRTLLTHLATALMVAGALTALLYLPVIIASGPNALTSNDWVKSRGFRYLFANYPASISRTWELWTIDVPRPAIWVFSAAFAVALLQWRRIAGEGARVLLAAALLIPPLVLAQRVVPYVRVWLFLLPLTAALTGAGLWLVLQYLGVRERPYSSLFSAAAALCCFLTMCVPDLRGTRLAYRTHSIHVEEASLWLKDHVKPGDVIAVKGAAWSPLTYYFRRHAVPLVNRPAPCDGMSIIYTLKGGARNPASGPRRVMTLGTQGEDPGMILLTSCLAWSPTVPPQLVYDNGGIRIYEGLAVPTS